MGAKSTLNQPLAEAHKFRALVDWVAAHPYQEVSVNDSRGDGPPLRIHPQRSSLTRTYLFDALGRLVPARKDASQLLVRGSGTRPGTGRAAAVLRVGAGR
ncbi:MAG: hypothetical protein GF331_22000 [Chitinivibrionales bacterium]|nr:hypothetical protein [Chitinivibrionales bacterium]